ncbi:Mediator of RNA polymerase II transcription subunit 6 [Ascosphaera aggregata]|nr:Mediator of RNA polymerase II transcription subunit 6 [Ascosphaera aggregata]
MVDPANLGGAPLEEITWRSPGHVQTMGGFLHSNNILFYFAESPFFDGTSNNANLLIQATHNESMRHFIETREAFENRLKLMQGLEFVVAHDPILEYGAALEAAAKEASPGQHQQLALPQGPSNIWVIRKQYRRKFPGRPDDVDILSTYFIVEDSVFMAPSVSGVVGNRMTSSVFPSLPRILAAPIFLRQIFKQMLMDNQLSTVTSLIKAFSAISSLPLFSASYGHTYTPTVPKTIEAARLTRSANRHKPTTPTPGVSEGITECSETMTPAESAAMIQNAYNLAKGIQLMRDYGNEYIDELPLLGEPGSFLFSSVRKPEAQPAGRQTTLPSRIAMNSPFPASAASTKPGTPSGKLTDRSVVSTAAQDKVRREFQSGSA